MKEVKRREREARREEKIREKEKKKQKVDTSIKFTPQEVELFERRHENGYDLTIDSRYMLWLNSTHPEEAERLRSKNLQSTVEDTVMSSDVGGKGDGSTNQEGLCGDDQHQKLPANSKNTKDTMSSFTYSTAKKGRNASVRTTRSATLKQQSIQKKGEQAGQSTRKIGGSRIKKVDGSTTIFSTGTKSGIVTRSQTQNSKNAKSSDSSVSKPRKKTVASTAAKVSKIVTRSNKRRNHSPSPAPESDTSESLAISSVYEEGEYNILTTVPFGSASNIILLYQYIYYL